VLENFTIDTFVDRIGERFLLLLDSGETLELELAEATEVGAAPEAGQRAPFSVVFLGPTDPVLPQRIYGFEHDELGAFEIFVVPIGRDASGTSYEATFA
jgi:uncharacterized protein DUF6916